MPNVWADMYCMWLLGKWSEKQVWGCGFRLRVSEWRDPEANGAWNYLGASCPSGSGQGAGKGRGIWCLRGKGGKTFKANGQKTLCPTGSPRQEAQTQPQWSHTTTIRPWTSTSSHCGLFYNLEPHCSLQSSSMVIILSQDSTFTLFHQVLLLILPIGPVQYDSVSVQHVSNVFDFIFSCNSFSPVVQSFAVQVQMLFQNWRKSFAGYT